MSLLATIATILFAATASAQTTQMWLPSPYLPSSAHIGFYASVVAASPDTTTLALSFDNSTDLSAAGYIAEASPQTVTFYGASRFESVQTTSDGPAAPAATLTSGCEKDFRGGAVCIYGESGKGAWEKYCDAASSPDADLPKWCYNGEEVPASVATSSYTVRKHDLATYQIVITAGGEKLSATAAARPKETGSVRTSTTTEVVVATPGVTRVLALAAPSGEPTPVAAGGAAPLGGATGAGSALAPLHAALIGLAAVVVGLSV